MTIVMKFGGTSVGSAERIKNVADIIKLNLAKKPVVVLSAVGGITDKLILAANEAKQGKDVDNLLKEINDKHYEILKELKLEKNIVEELLLDFSQLINQIKQTKEADSVMMDIVQSYGERISTRIAAAYLNKLGVNAKQFDAWDIGMITTAEPGNAEPIDKDYKLMKESLKNVKEIPIITGFIGKTKEGVITTLGRGGSDYTAAMYGVALGASEIQIWTDVDGIMTTDPRIVKEARTIEKVSFAEASELAYFGAKVLHPKTILPAMRKNIPVRVLNTHSPKAKGTLILKEANNGNKTNIKAIAFKRNICVLNIISTRMLDSYGFLARVFDAFGDHKKTIDMISTSEVSVSLTLDNDKNIDGVIEELKPIANIKAEKNRAIIAIVGEKMKHVPGTAAKIFSTLGKNGINLEMISQGASEINIGFVIRNEDVDKTVQLLHKEIFSS